MPLSTSFLPPLLHAPSTRRRPRTHHVLKCSLPEPSREQLESLRQSLSSAVNAQNFSLAAKLRDQIAITEAQATDQLAATLANDAFYKALTNADVDAMARVWLPSDTVSCAHALGGLVVGYEDVVESWRRVFIMGRATEVEIDDVRVTVKRNAAWVVCKQTVTAVRGGITVGGERIATNIMQKRRGRWLFVHHHASPIVMPDEESPPDQQPPPPPPPPTGGTGTL